MPDTTAALALRYPEVPVIGPVNATIEGLLAHRSVRHYLADPVTGPEIATLIAAASSAPTSSNLQVWSVVAVTDPAIRAELAEVAGGQAHITQAPLILVWIADLSRATRLAQAAGQVLEGTPYTESYLVAAIDAALAAQNALVAAESLGLGTCYIGALRNDPDRVAALLGLPPMAMAVAGLVVGHPDPARPAAVKPRLPQSVVLHHNRYDHSHETAGIAALDLATNAFRAAEGLGPQTWSDLVRARLGKLKNLSGRHVLKERLRALGFAMK